MDERFPKRKKNRLQGYDYSRDGFYFITSNAKGDPFAFGRVKDQRMEPNAAGRIVEEEWWDMVHRYSYVLCPAFIVMPDHIHGIIGIDRAKGWHLSVDEQPPKIHSLSFLIGRFKMRASKRIRSEQDPTFRWHRSFHEHIIRNERSLYRITRYIRENPKNYWKDKGGRGSL